MLGNILTIVLILLTVVQIFLLLRSDHSGGIRDLCALIRYLLSSRKTSGAFDQDDTVISKPRLPPPDSQGSRKKMNIPPRLQHEENNAASGSQDFSHSQTDNARLPQRRGHPRKRGSSSGSKRTTKKK